MPGELVERVGEEIPERRPLLLLAGLEGLREGRELYNSYIYIYIYIYISNVTAIEYEV